MSRKMEIPSLPILPWNIKEQIIGHTDLSTRFTLRKCSKDLRFHVNRTELCLEKINLYLNKNGVQLTLKPKGKEQILVEYCKATADSTVFLEDRKIVGRVDYLKQVVSDVIEILNNPKASVKVLKISGNTHSEKLLQTLSQEFKNQKSSKLKVEIFEIRFGMTEDQILGFLDLLQPGFFKEMCFSVSEEGTKLEKVREMEQWKQAKLCYLDGPHNVPLMELSHFQNVNLRDIKTDAEELKELVEKILQTNPNFGFFMIGPVEYDLKDVNQWLSPYHDSGFETKVIKFPTSDTFMVIDATIHGMFCFGRHTREFLSLLSLPV